ncbi:MAG: SpoIIE family protein phosphatase [gamma proteobacterium symbiont of Taylorina sp.]|nr:SpoIIE family protein phosphatase [gamma proteobacterium symbiont of Taylorina sp.]
MAYSNEKNILENLSKDELIKEFKFLKDERNKRLKSDMVLSQAHKQLEIENTRIKSIQEFIGEALKLNSEKDVYELTIETLIEAYQCENALFLSYISSNQWEVAYDFSDLFEIKILEIVQSKSEYIRLIDNQQIFKNCELLQNANGMMAFYDNGINKSAIIAYNSREMLGTFETITETHLTSFEIISNQIGIILKNISSTKILKKFSSSLEIKVKQRTKELEHQQQIVQTAEERSRLLLTSAGEGIFGVGSDGLVNFINPAALEMLQYNESEILGQKIHSVIHHTRTDGRHYPVEQCPMYHAFSEGKVSHIDDEVLWRKDGTNFPVEYQAQPIIKDKQITGSVVTFSDITERINAHNLLLKQQLEIKEIHKQTRDSIKYAALIQGALVPDNKVFQKFFQDYFAIWHPKDIVGGDIYLVEEMSEDEVIIMVIDCTGHGVPGAFVTMLVKAIERQLTANLHKDKTISPANMLSVFNRSIKNLLQQENVDSISNAGFDGGILYYNKKEKILRFAGANTPLFMIQNSELKTIKGNRHSIGYKKSDASYVFTDHTIDVSSSTQIYMTTDGYLDQNGGEKGFPYGKKRFTQFIIENAGETFADQQELLLYELQRYQKDEETNDDVTVIGIKI